jgi:universal stress protein A
MKRLEKIIIPTDLTESSRRGLSYGCWLAAEEQAGLVILHVASFYDAWAAHSEELAHWRHDLQTWTLDRLLSEATFDLNRFLEPHMPDLKKAAGLVKRVVLGIVPEQIAEVAEEENADLIIMSPRRRRVLRHLIFGAITDKVTRLSPCPVLSVTEPKPEKSRRGRTVPAFSIGPRPRTAEI